MTPTPANHEPIRIAAAPRWVDVLFMVFPIYLVGVSVAMARVFGPTVAHYVGLFSDSPANALSALLATAACIATPRGQMKNAWRAIAASLNLYLIGTVISSLSWLGDIDPFPGISDVFFCAFYATMLIAALLLIRAAAVRVPWLQLSLDATIFVIGFGSFFWFLVIRPGTPDPDIVKETLSQAYAELDCIVLLMLGVLLVTGAGKSGRRSVALMLTLGFAAMFLGDIIWSVAKIRGYYVPGGVQDYLYLWCHLPLAVAAREQLRDPNASIAASNQSSDALPRALPYAAMFVVFLGLTYYTRTEMDGPATIMTCIVFSLTLLLMIRQGVVLRESAAHRERLAARMVEDRYASLIANASDVIMIVDDQGSLKFASPASERTFGIAPDAVESTNLIELWSGEDRDRLKMFLAELASSPGGNIGPIELKLERGTDRYVLETVGSNLSGDLAVRGLALNFRDVSERKVLEEQLRQLAFHDPLTLLANRNLFRDRVEHALTLTQRRRHSVGVMFLDLDNFKNINDSLGHDAGDRLLQTAAQRIVKASRSTDTVARLGGDEFAILLESIKSIEDVQVVADAVIASLNQPLALNATEIRIAASIGVAMASADTAAEVLLSNADIAMYHAKSAGKNRYVVFQPHMQESMHERFRLEADISRALQNQEFFLEYQPIVDLGTGSLLGVEALLRWRHPQLGVLPPGRFIEVAEECGQIVALGRWVLDTACRDICSWRHIVAGGNGLRVAVNISGRHLQHVDFVQHVAEALRESQLEAGNLVIELTESTVMHNTDANLDRLHRLKKLGVRLAIDDFGTGYSSLAYLHRFPIDILKIDRSFVGRLTATDDGPELARAVITLGETLGLDTVAEGIELEQQVPALLALGCVAGQGYLFAKPGSLDELGRSEFVAKRNALWNSHVMDESLSATGRFKALRSINSKLAGVA
ncbi:MAG TPA: EAL domain-containing protein [Steroidobacteraceae bacterium]|jgi:diguanylate cyclase (GGDEF)-like protein/PAS domain S-box-containing protein